VRPFYAKYEDTVVFMAEFSHYETQKLLNSIISKYSNI